MRSSRSNRAPAMLAPAIDMGRRRSIESGSEDEREVNWPKTQFGKSGRVRIRKKV